MLRTRLIVGTVLAALTAGMLLIDERLAPWFPFLFGTIAVLSTLGTLELASLLPDAVRPNRIVAVAGVLSIVVLAWGKVIAVHGQFQGPIPEATGYVLSGFAAIVVIAFLREMAVFQAPGRTLPRLAMTVWMVAYLGLLPSFLAMIRTNTPNAHGEELHRGTIALALAIFVPKACDIGAYFTGRAFGRRKMAPTLSPGKTWEGAAGGLAMAVVVAFGINRLGPVIPGAWWNVALFGLVVGAAGMLGDLAESMIKRDCERKDASQAVPGFGGVLDVVDSILFASPVAYWFLA